MAELKSIIFVRSSASNHAEDDTTEDRVMYLVETERDTHLGCDVGVNLNPEKKNVLGSITMWIVCYAKL